MISLAVSTLVILAMATQLVLQRLFNRKTALESCHDQRQA